MRAPCYDNRLLAGVIRLSRGRDGGMANRLLRGKNRNAEVEAASRGREWLVGVSCAVSLQLAILLESMASSGIEISCNSCGNVHRNGEAEVTSATLTRRALICLPAMIYRA